MLLPIVLCLVLLTVIYIYNFLKGIYKYWEKKGVPFAKAEYIFGNFKDVVFGKATTVDVLERIYQSDVKSRYIGFYQFLSPILLIRDPELIKQITIKDFDSFPDHNFSPSNNIDPMWDNLLITKTAKHDWVETRAKISHTFTPQKLRLLLPLMQESVLNLNKFFKLQNEMVIIEAKDVFLRVCNDIIASVALAVSVNSLENKNNPFFVLGKKVANFSGIRKLLFLGYSSFPKLMRFFRMRLFPKDASDFFESVIDNSLKLRGENNAYRSDFIQMLTETKFRSNGKLEMNVREITAHCLNFYFGGFESISSILSFAAYELALNPDIQNRVYNEIINNLKDLNENLTYETISNMKYLNMVVTEVLRLHTPNFAIDRKCRKPYTIEAKLPGETPLHIEKGTVIWIPLREIHLDLKYFPNPKKFDPERFNQENKTKIVPCSYIPFGSGPRHCVADRYTPLSMKLVLIEILKHFEFVRVEKTEVPLTYNTDSFFLEAKNGLWLGVKPRI